jgi:hypothetical protein
MGGGSTTTSSGSSSVKSTFDPRGDPLIQGLVSQFQEGSQNSSDLGNFLRNFLQGGGNPNTESMIARGNEAAQQGLNTNLAKVRSQGNRGGIARDVINQAGTVGQFQKDLAAQNEATRFGAFNQDRGANLSAANLLSGLSGQGQNSALGLLGLLRGQEGTNQSTSKTKNALGISDIAGIAGGIAGI